MNITTDNNQTILLKVPKVDNGGQRVKKKYRQERQCRFHTQINVKMIANVKMLSWHRSFKVIKRLKNKKIH